jgi:hypothetical protein
MIAAILCASALALFFWPKAKREAAFAPLSPATPTVRRISFQESIANLANVRARLATSDPSQLTDDTKKAIDALTLALVAGSGEE